MNTKYSRKTNVTRKVISGIMILSLLIMCLGIQPVTPVSAGASHQHDWCFYDDDNSIYAECENYDGECPVDNWAEVRIETTYASGEKYYYDASSLPVELIDNNWTDAGFELPTINYKDDCDDYYSFEQLEDEFGEFIAEIQYNGAWAELEFTIWEVTDITIPTMNVEPELDMNTPLNGLTTLTRDDDYTVNKPVSVSSISWGWVVGDDEGTIEGSNCNYKYCDNHTPEAGENYAFVIRIVGDETSYRVDVNDDVENAFINFTENACFIIYEAGTLGSDGNITGGCFDKYTVTFHANGGSGTMDPVKVKGEYWLPDDTTFTPPTSPEGLAFAGWMEDPDDGYTVQNLQNIWSDRDFYAKWEIPMSWVGSYFHYYYDGVEDSTKFYPLSLIAGYDYTALDKAGEDYELDTTKTPSLTFRINVNEADNVFNIYYKSKNSGNPTPGPTPGPAPDPTPDPTPEPTPEPEKKGGIISPDNPDNSTVYAEADVEDSIAKVEPISDETIKKAIGDGDNESISLDFSNAREKVEGVELDKKTAEKIAAVLADSSNKIDKFELDTPESTVVLDRQALETIAATAGSAEDLIRIIVEDTNKQMNGLTEKQEKAIGSDKILATFDAYILAGNTRVHDLKGGQMTISVAWPFDDSIDSKKVTLTHMLHEGNAEVLGWTVNKVKGKKVAEFDTSSLSYFAFTYKEDEETLRKNAIALNMELKVDATEEGIDVTWGTTDASGYLVYASYCGQPLKLVKVVKDASVDNYVVTKLNGEDIDLTRSYKVRVKAYKSILGKRVVVGKSIISHIAGQNSKKYSNPIEIKLTSKKKLSLAVGETSVITGNTVLADTSKKQLSDKHAKNLRFVSSDLNVATVDKNGMITAVGAGKCSIYVYAKNGYTKKVTVTVTK